VSTPVDGDGMLVLGARHTSAPLQFNVRALHMIAVGEAAGASSPADWPRPARELWTVVLVPV
jgi:hypothetical protein